MNYSQLSHQLIHSQISEWELAANNYKGLEEIRTKIFTYNGYSLQVQFNPKRFVSSTAMVDAKSIQARPCFLCQKNLPPQQKGIDFGTKYQILVNPFPIFKEHLTIPVLAHVDQRIQGNFEDMLNLAEALTDFVVFYNGPQCGASAPDHFHFQASIKNSMPIEWDFNNHILQQYAGCQNDINIHSWKNYLRGIITLEGDNKAGMVLVFDRLYSRLNELRPNDSEPLMNILAWYTEGKWVAHVFLRTKHRPQQFFDKGAGQILLSPASVDMGGLLITPREEDFEKVTAADISDIFEQVCETDAFAHEVAASLID